MNMAEQEKESVFRQKALERISSPEQLSSYLKVTSFSIWATLAAVILLLNRKGTESFEEKYAGTLISRPNNYKVRRNGADHGDGHLQG